MSNSSPVEGLQTALRTYARQDRKIAIYIFGDDFRGSSYDRVMETLRNLNVDTAHRTPAACAFTGRRVRVDAHSRSVRDAHAGGDAEP